MSKHLYYTDDKGDDHKLSGRPKLIGLNMTEWWWVKEIMENQDCKYSTSGYNDVFEIIVTIPGGDSYNLYEYSKIIMKVEKLPEVA